MPIGVSSFDRAVRAWILAHENAGLHHFFDVVSTVGGVSPMMWAGVAVAIFLMARGRRRASIALATTPLLALFTYAGTRRVISRQRPPGFSAYHEVSNSFPSAHSTTATAVCCTTAYILWRERMLSAPVAISVAILPPLLIGVSRLYLDVHWATDVIAGWIAGILIAAVAGIVHGRAIRGR